MKRKTLLVRLVVLAMLGLLVSGCGGGGGKVSDDANYSAEVNALLAEFEDQFGIEDPNIVADMFAIPAVIDGVEIPTREGIAAWAENHFNEADRRVVSRGRIVFSGDTANVSFVLEVTDGEEDWKSAYSITLQRKSDGWYITHLQETRIEPGSTGSVTLSWSNPELSFDLCVIEPNEREYCAENSLFTANGSFDQDATADNRETSETYTWDTEAAPGEYYFFPIYCDGEKQEKSPAATLTITIGGKTSVYNVPAERDEYDYSYNCLVIWPAGTITINPGE